MGSTIFHPDVKLRHKLFIIVLLIGILTMAAWMLMGMAIGSEEGGARGAMIGLVVAIAATVLWVVPALLIVPVYYRSLQYEIHDDEVIVRAGVVTKSVKHVPFRTVTNLKLKRGPLDRLFGIGTLNIQTAGMSGQTGAEESLTGLPNHEEVYQQVATSLRQFRGGMSPTQAEDELAPGDGQTLNAILQELRAIRETVTKA